MASTTNYSWNTPDDTALVKDGASAIRTLGSSVDSTLFTALGGTYPGLRLVKTQVIGAGVSSVTITNAFSTTYKSYRIQLRNCDASNGDQGLKFKFNNVSGTNYYGGIIYTSYAGVIGTSVANGVNSGFDITLTSSNDNTSFDIDVFNPFETTPTTIHGTGGAGNGFNAFSAFGEDRFAGSQTGFVLTPATGTITGGTITVYGYGAS